MRAILCKELGPADKLVIEDVPSPQVSGDGVKVKVKAAGLNFPDTLIIEGKYQIKPELPFSPGGEMAGEIIEVGPDVKNLKPGMRVMGLTGYGSFAEEMVIGESRVIPVPDGMKDETAAAFSMVYGTSYHALKQRANIQPGETLVVTGAAGGTGLAAVQIGKAMGARVIAVCSTAEKLEVARANGADVLINYSEKDLKTELKAATNGQGADVAYDAVGGDAFDALSRCMAWNGRLLVIGFASGTIPKLPVNLTLVKGYGVLGVFWGTFTMKQPKDYAQNMRELLQWYVDGKVKVVIDQAYPLENTVDALNKVMNRQVTGKVILTC